MSLSLYIDDGYTATKTLPAAPGLHPEVAVRYRPALARVRAEYQYAANAGADKLSAFEESLLARQRVELNGEPLDPARAARLKPALRQKLLDLVLGYAGEDEAADEKNSPGG